MARTEAQPDQRRRNEDSAPDRPSTVTDRIIEKKAPARTEDPESPADRKKRAEENLEETGRAGGKGKSPGEGDPI